VRAFIRTQVDPLRVRSASPTAAAEDLESNRRRLVEASQDALDLIFASASSFPEALKHTFLIAHNEILQKLPNMRCVLLCLLLCPSLSRHVD
jgi:hypothetical protein